MPTTIPELPAISINSSAREQLVTEQKVQSSNSPESKWFIWEVIKDGFYLSAYVIAGIAANIFFPCIAPALFTIASATMLTLVVVKLTDRYNITLLDGLKAKMNEIESNYPRIRIISFIFALILSLVSPLVGSILGGAYGLYCGMLLDKDTRSRQLAVKLGSQDGETDLAVV